MFRRPPVGLLAPLAVGAAARLVVWALMAASWNDAYAYANNTEFIREGAWDSVSRFMYTFYSVVAAAVDVFVRDPILAGELVSFFAGLAVIPLVYQLTRLLSGPSAATVAAWLVALHPRLIEYSTVGYTESLLTALVAGGVYLAARHLVDQAEGAEQRRLGDRRDLSATALFAVAFLVRNETLFYLPVVLAVLGVADVVRRGVGAGLRETVLRLAVAFVVAAIPTAWIGAALGESPIFRKAGGNVAVGAVYDVENLGRWHAEMYALDEQGRLVGPPEAPQAITLADRARIYTANLLNVGRFYLLRLVFSPLMLLFAVLGLLGVRYRRGALAGEVLLFGVWLVPHVFYPLLIVQPQYFVQTLPLLAVWAGRGLVRAAELLRDNAGWPARAGRAAVAAALALTALPLVASTALLARERVVDRGPLARVAATWVAQHATRDPFMGSDPGVTYYSRNFERVALPVGVAPGDLSRVARANDAGFVILTSSDLEWRPELAPLLAASAPQVAGLHRELRHVERGSVLVIYRVEPPIAATETTRSR